MSDTLPSATDQAWAFIGSLAGSECDCDCYGHDEGEPCTADCSECTWCHAARLLELRKQEATA